MRHQKSSTSADFQKYKIQLHQCRHSLRWCWCDYLGDGDIDGRAGDGGEGWMSNQAELGLEWMEVAKGDF